MFSEIFEYRAMIILLENKTSVGEVLAILEQDQFTLEDMSRLILAPKSLYPSIVAEAVRRREARWHGAAFLMPPLYVSDGDPKLGKCPGGCIYCPWEKAGRQIVRISPEETAEEVKLLTDKGYGDVELVAACDPDLLSANRCAEFILAAHAAGAKNVGLNFFPPATVDDYRILADAGLRFSVAWQETYHTNRYRQVHPTGYKANMEYRLDAHDRALQGGVPMVGVAFLGGIYDWRFDALSAMAHAEYLRKEYNADIIFGTPRIKPVPDTEFQPMPYSDDEFQLVGALYTLFAPDALPWWATRECYELSAQAAQGGGCIFTLDSSTKVAGYSKGEGTAQFPVHTRPFDEGVAWLRSQNLDPHVHLPCG